MVARNKVVLSGSLGGVEAWSTTMHFDTPGGGAIVEDGESLTLWAQDIAAALDTAIGGALETGLSTVGTISEVACYSYGATGPAYAVGLAEATYSGAGTVTNAFQIAQVISSRAALAGSAYRGRNYWPALGTATGANGKFSTPGAGLDAATNFAQLVETIASLSAVTGGFGPVIYSPTRDLTTPVVQYRWGDVPDVQRRRVDALQEVFTVVPYPV